MHHILKLGLAILAVSTMKAAAAEGKGPPAPAGLGGFSGQVRGVVIGKGEHNAVTFKVARVIKVWKNNKATNPKALEGKTWPVAPSWHKVNGKWHPVEMHLKFLRTLKPGEELTLELKHAEREYFAILELTKEQRERAEGDDGEKEEHAEREREGEREHAEERHEKAHEHSSKDAEMRALRREVDRLRAENKELRRLRR
jgi:hypothetical protein